MPCRSMLCHEFTSRMTWSAASIHVVLLPTEEDGMSSPSAVMPVTSMTAVSSLPSMPAQVCGPEWDRWMSQ